MRSERLIKIAKVRLIETVATNRNEHRDQFLAGGHMRVLGDALGALIGALERSEEVAERASINGKVYVG